MRDTIPRHSIERSIKSVLSGETHQLRRPGDRNDRRAQQDFERAGHGFWFQGSGIEVTDNVAATQRSTGIIFFLEGLSEPGTGRTMFPTENLIDPSIANGADSIRVHNVPILQFHDNEAYGSHIGASSNFNVGSSEHDQQSVLEDLLLWNNEYGMNVAYSHQTIIRNVEIYAHKDDLQRFGVQRNDRTDSAVTDSQALTIEAWVLPGSATQSGPARIVTLSSSASNRNFTLGQQGLAYHSRLRTTTTGNNGVRPALITPNVVDTNELSHVVYTRDASGTARSYIDSEQVVTGAIGGSLSN